MNGNLKLTRISSTLKAKAIETPSGVFILDAVPTTTSTKYKSYDRNKSAWLAGVFDSTDFVIENYVHNPAVNSNFEEDLLVHGPLGKYMYIVQDGNFAVGLKRESLSGTSTYSYYTSTYNYDIDFIAVYNLPSSGYTYSYFTELSAPRALLSGLPFAHLSEIGLDLDTYHDFDNAIIYADSFCLKNMYDENYDVQARIVIVGANSQATLNNTRIYKRLGVNNSDAWVSYKIEKNLSGIVSGSCPDSSMTTIAMNYTTETPDNILSKYEFIERIKGVNRAGDRLHKSNIFSIRIKNSHLNESIADTTTRERVQDGINKIIKELIRKITPAYTQLWKIEWKGQ